jgi:CBS domain-containing protein
VPVVQDGRVLGVASAQDLIRYLLKSVDAEDSTSPNVMPPIDTQPPGAFLT